MAMHTQALHMCVQTDRTYLQKSDSGSDFQLELGWCRTKSSHRNGRSEECENPAKPVSLPVSAVRVTSLLHQFLHTQHGENESPVWQRPEIKTVGVC